ncbi:MAG: hypothetical protein NT175_01855 [Bacteroidetes bacterium]|nr:hypothetical protein [Bacteroidota bacterium]
MENKLCEKNKIKGLSYAFTDKGIELPVLDITHPLFTESINEDKLKKMLTEIEKKGEKRAESFQKMPAFFKNYLAKRSYIMAGLLLNDTDDAFLSGMSTLMMKLGPGLIGKGRKRFFDRLASKSFGAIVLRMRVRDICHCQAEALIPLLIKSPGKSICFINIAGGTASDSINTLILIQKKDPSLLQNRKIEINVLDVDTFGPGFAGRCVESLKASGARFNDLDVSFRYIPYNWNSTARLTELLAERKEWIEICASEGGLFEYASDEEIIQNLNTIYDNSQDHIIIAGSLLRDIETVDPGIRAAMKITHIKARLLGIDGLNHNLEKTRWRIDSLSEGNPRYVIFSLKKIVK